MSAARPEGAGDEFLQQLLAVLHPQKARSRTMTLVDLAAADERQRPVPPGRPHRHNMLS
jgi:hypothetical protein